MNLRSGTTFMAHNGGEKNLLSSKDVCSIIKMCAQSKVSELKFGELHLSFGYFSDESRSEVPNTRISEAKLKEEEQKYIAESEIRSKDDEIDQMLIEDPVKFEELLEQGEFDADEFRGSEESDEAKEA